MKHLAKPSKIDSFKNAILRGLILFMKLVPFGHKLTYQKFT